MKYIRKLPYNSEGLKNAHAKPPTSAEEARKRWTKFKPHKKRLLQQLLTEQYQLCCYSEVDADKQGLGYHIEHVINKGMNPSKTFDYANLAASAIHSDNISSLPKAQVFGGHATGKANTFNESLFMPCNDANCSGLFTYLSNGGIIPRDGLKPGEFERAEYTIKLLNLDSPFLVVLRRNRWQALDDEFNVYVDDHLELDVLVVQELLPSEGRLKDFFSLTRQFFGAKAEAILAENAPELI